MHHPTPQRLKTLCDQSKLTIAVAESASGGHLAALLTSVSGSSSYFRGGVVAYHIDVKVEILGVDGSHASSCDCVSEQVAREMASGVRKALSTDVGISITGYAEPDGNGESYAWLGFDVRGHKWAERVVGPDASFMQSRRVASQEDFAQAALAGVSTYLEGRFSGTLGT
jgi:PncC family amidohydrolase